MKRKNNILPVVPFLTYADFIPKYLETLQYSLYIISIKINEHHFWYSPLFKQWGTRKINLKKFEQYPKYCKSYNNYKNTNFYTYCDKNVCKLISFLGSFLNFRRFKLISAF